MDATTDWRTNFVASAALLLRVKAKKKWPGWSDADQAAAKAACRQAAEDIEGIPALRARAEAAEAALAAAQAELAQARADLRVMAGLAHTGIHERGLVDGTRPALDATVVDALEGALMYAGHMPDADVAALIRRALEVS